MRHLASQDDTSLLLTLVAHIPNTISIPFSLPLPASAAAAAAAAASASASAAASAAASASLPTANQRPSQESPE